MARVQSGQFAAVIRAYMASPKWASLARNTQVGWGAVLILAEHPDALGAQSVSVIRPALVQAFLDGLAATPAKQAVAKNALRGVEKWALVRDLLPYPITTGTEVIGSQGGHKPWTDAQVALAEEHVRPDLVRVITLAANTGQRCGDIARMTWGDLEVYQGRLGLNVVQQKTAKRLWVPVTQPLERAMDGWDRAPGPMIGCVTDSHKLSVLWYRERAENAELKPLAGLVLHGLRATACVRLRRAGATELQIADMVGMSEPMVHRYCRLSDQRDNAIAAVVHLDTARAQKRTSAEP